MPQLEDLGISQFRHAIFSKGKAADGRSLGGRVLAGMCDLIEHDRVNEEDLFDATLLRDSIAMMHIFGIYGKAFEPQFLNQSREYFEKFVHDRSNSGIKEYIAACDKLLNREALRCDTYNFDSTTKRMLLDGTPYVDQAMHEHSAESKWYFKTHRCECDGIFEGSV
jgi:cullin-4